MLRLAVIFFVFSLLLAFPQVLPVGSVDGAVKDPSGALLPGARITLTHRDTGQSRTAVTGDVGSYFVPLLNPGGYTVVAEKEGFRKGVQEVVVETGKKARADFALELGQLTESVAVTVQAPLIEASTASISRNIQQRSVQDLPLLGRNPLRLVQLSAGITWNNNTQGPQSTSSTLQDVSGSSYLSVNGSNNRVNEFLIDGIPNNIQDRANYLPPVDVVEEFTVQTNALDAEYGHGGGAYINITSKSGTNEFHGQVYEFLRNDRLNANTFFNNRQGVGRSPLRYNQFGAAAGGPAVKNKVFWFFNWESYRQRAPQGGFYTTPSDLQRRGDFSQTLDRLGRRMDIYDPFSTKRNEAGQYTRDPFPNNSIPLTRWDPVARNVIPRYPTPNIPGDQYSATNNLYTIFSAPVDSDSYSVRVDPQIKNHRVFARWSRNRSPQNEPTPFDIGGLERRIIVQTSVGLSDTYTISPTMILTAQAGYSRWTQEGIHPSFDLVGLGFPDSLVRQMQETIYPSFVNSDMMTLGAKEGNWFEHTNTLSFQTGVTKIAGRQQLKWGFQMQVKQQNNVGADRPSGMYTFSRAFTQGPDPNRTGTNVGNGIASLLLGTPVTGTLNLRAYSAAQSPFYGWYVQDDIKVTPKLTLNIGLRYEVSLGATERYNRSVFGLDRETPNPIEAQAQANYAKSPIPELAAKDFKVTGGLVFVTPERRRNAITDKNNWAPRLGVAYRVLPRTVVRGGFGVFYSLWWQIASSQTGFAAESSMVTSLDGGRTPADLLRNPFPQGLVKPVGASLGMRTLLGQNVSALDMNRKAIRNDRWNFGIQQQVDKSTAIEVAYVGQRAQQLPVVTESGHDQKGRNVNFVPQNWFALGSRLQDSVTNPFVGLIGSGALSRPTVARSTLLQPYPQFGSMILSYNSLGRSWYHSLQTTGSRRMTAGLDVQATYTWSKQLEQLRYIEPSDPEPSKMIGAFDNPHRVTMAAIYEVPFGKGRRLTSRSAILNKIAGGWQVSTMYTYMTGGAVLLPAAVATGISPKIANRKIDLWFNRDSMKILPPFTARRIPWMWNDLRSDGQNHWDIGILKRTALYKERATLQFRAELSNAFNRPMFGTPNVSPASGSFGRVTTQANSPREIQLALKAIF